jgi:DNA-binding MarR family transcriptional regulator
VPGKLAQEIRQQKPFSFREEEAYLNLGRTWAFLQAPIAELLKAHQLTGTQYNMLRILRGAGDAGVTCSQATERMITPDPDVTRLLDRLEARGLIVRSRSNEDRRTVITRITREGLDLVDRIDEPLHAAMRKHLGHIGPKQLDQLIAILEALRDPPE